MKTSPRSRAVEDTLVKEVERVLQYWRVNINTEKGDLKLVPVLHGCLLSCLSYFFGNKKNKCLCLRPIVIQGSASFEEESTHVFIHQLEKPPLLNRVDSGLGRNFAR